MPVIRLTPTTTVFGGEQKKALLDQLKKELAAPSEKGPAVFEIPLGTDPSEKMDVLVVWESWKDVPSETRTQIILDAYEEKKKGISQALGVTYQEAIEQQVLPYAVLPMIKSGELDDQTVKAAMLRQGGISLEGGKVDLRFPTLSMAKDAHRALSNDVPKGYWSIVQSVSPI